MLKIEFDKPISLLMEVIETDDHVPSMRVEAKVSISQFQHTIDYRGSFWIECAGFSNFVAALDSSPLNAVLKDMSGNFSLTLSELGGAKMLHWEFAKQDIGAERKAAASISAEVDDDMLQAVHRAFEEFPVWW